MPDIQEIANAVNEIYTDMYKGKDVNNPSITTRLASVENDMELVKHDLYSNGTKGFIQETRDYISKQQGMWLAVIAIGMILTILQSLSTFHEFQRPINQIPAQHSLEE
jgi:hypothetical protein